MSDPPRAEPLRPLSLSLSVTHSFVHLHPRTISISFSVPFTHSIPASHYHTRTHPLNASHHSLTLLSYHNHFLVMNHTLSTGRYYLSLISSFTCPLPPPYQSPTPMQWLSIAHSPYIRILLSVTDSFSYQSRTPLSYLHNSLVRIHARTSHLPITHSLSSDLSLTLSLSISH